ncbi:MAG: phenylalanine--tRNA ligase subunit beta [Rhodospirillaceae bacterium]|jgi:phenylalanyl-tRNA synthetase beta chain|nr:phenylalanine--tRNA ligase subunit beta [Rhodospirillaceae bacterium]
MKFTLNWLKDHLDTDAPLSVIDEKLTSIGLEVEGIEDRAKGYETFVVGHVVSCEPHPDADRLRVCVVDTGAEQTQVVCGAPNARQGMKGVFAPAGTHVPGTGMDLKKTKIRGVESSGMLCSEREMGLSDEHDGIIDLPEDTATGQSYVSLMGLDDPVIEIALTPDRADCAGIRGIARDLSATGIGTLKPWPYVETPAAFDSPIQWVRALGDNGDACPMVVGRAFRNVKNGPSPQWLQDRLRAIGLRPISALVDITNYVTFDLGRPLHVFDIDKLSGGALTMRFAEAGEKIAALDGKTYTLDDQMTVIGDGAGAQAIGGIMGGESTGCTEDTTSVFLEAALFDPIRTAATGRKLAIESDARYRFERGVDPASVLWGADVATKLILDLCGGEASELSIAGETPPPHQPIALDPTRISTLGGMDMDIAEARRILDALGFETTINDDRIMATPPSWRFDVEGEACLVEEALRISGFDNIPAVPLIRETPLSQPALTPPQRRVSFARKVLASRGMLEAVTWSFTTNALATLFGGGADALRLANPISADLDTMRPSIMPNLIAAVGRNADRGNSNACLFEVGADYQDDTPTGQRTVAAGVRAGDTGDRHWSTPARAWDVFDAKADSMAILKAAGAPVNNLQATPDAPDWYHPGRSGVLRLGPAVLANFGEIHPKILKTMDVDGPIVAFEVFFDAIPKARKKQGKTRPALVSSPFQPVRRDFAFVLDESVSSAKVISAVRAAEKKLISDVSIFDVYAGANLGDGKKSIALSVTLQPVDGTMTDETIENISAQIIVTVEKQTGGILRG